MSFNNHGQPERRKASWTSTAIMWNLRQIRVQVAWQTVVTMTVRAIALVRVMVNAVAMAIVAVTVRTLTASKSIRR